MSRTTGLARFQACARGNVAMEFALILPFLLLLLLASFELARFVILYQKVDRVALTTADLVARAETITESQIADIFVSALEVADPFDLAAMGVVFVSSITNPDGNGAKVAWQRSGGGSYSASSKLGVEGATASLPAGFQVRQGETVIISEVYFDFDPMLSDMIVPSQVLYRQGFHRPRLGTLTSVDAG